MELPGQSTTYETALAELFSRIKGGSAGAIVRGLVNGPWLVLASRGLGSEPVHTLSRMPNGLMMLEAAARNSCLVTQGGDQIVWDGDRSAATHITMRPPSARARHAQSTLTVGVACPITRGRAVLGVIAMYGRHATLHRIEHLHILLAVSESLATAFGEAQD